MMTPKRPHLLDSLRFFRYGFLLCLVPMVQALFRFDMEGLLIALWQDAAILAVCLALSLALWAAARISVTPQAVVFRQGIGFHLRQTFARPALPWWKLSAPCTAALWARRACGCISKTMRRRTGLLYTLPSGTPLF